MKLISRITGESPTLGAVRDGEEVTTKADGTPLTDDEKRILAASSRFLDLEENDAPKADPAPETPTPAPPDEPDPVPYSADDPNGDSLS